jgi:hypothetical protein
MISLLLLIYSINKFRKGNYRFHRNVHHGEHFAVIRLQRDNTG